MRTHTSIGARILGGSQSPLLQLAEAVASSHHEKFDGTGYPKGLMGTNIPIAGRIVAVADAFDAITNDRPYRNGRSAKVALEVLRKEVGRHYEERLLDALECSVDAMAETPAAVCGPERSLRLRLQPEFSSVAARRV